VDYDAFMRTRAASRRNAAPEYVGGTVAWTGEIVPLIAHFPANAGTDRDLVFQPRPYARTVFQFVVRENTAQRGRQIFYVIWPGRLPDSFRHRHVVLIGRLDFHEEAVQKSRWPLLALAFVPLNEATGKPEREQVLLAEETRD
jgi:hypothetical protein